MATRIPVHLSAWTVNGESLALVGSAFNLKFSRGTPGKPVIGTAWSEAVGAQRSLTFSASGPLTVEKAAALFTMGINTDTAAFSMQIGAAAGATDGGAVAGNCVVSAFNIDGTADGEYEWSLDAVSTGTISYTPAAEESSSSSSSSSSS